MPKLSLAITDNDKEYLESILDYLMINHSQKFQISSFTKEDNLISFLNAGGNSLDILLINVNMYKDTLPLDNVREIILLTPGSALCIHGLNTINKYQPGNAIVSAIIDIVAQKSESALIKACGNKKTHVSAVYSPCGGSGKTIIAIGASIFGARYKDQVFYLNLETYQSTLNFFNPLKEGNLSGIFYYLKEKSPNLHLKIEATRQIDPETKVHYFSPPESICDIKETTPHEITTLIEELKIMGTYNDIFIDTSSDLSEMTLAVLEACDNILLVLPHDTLANSKLSLFLNELNILKKKKGLHLEEKITLVVNKYTNRQLSLNFKLDKSPQFILPYVENMNIFDGIKIFNLNEEFNDVINAIGAW